MSAKDASEVMERRPSLDMMAGRVRGRPSNRSAERHSSKEGASASSILRPLTRQEGKSAPRIGRQRLLRSGSAREQPPLRRAEDNAAWSGRQPRASIEGPPGSVTPGSHDLCWKQHGSSMRVDGSSKLVGAVKRARPEAATSASRSTTSGSGRFVSGARARESVAAVGEEHLPRAREGSG